MIKGLTVLLVLVLASVSQGALLTNFAASYAKYQACSVQMPASKCYKLYFDPEGISEGQVHLYIDAPYTGDELRFNFTDEDGVKFTHPDYVAFSPGDPVISQEGGRQRYQNFVRFNSNGEPPGGDIVIFEYHVHDFRPELGLEDVQIGFEFLPGDFITIFDPGPPPQSTRYDDTQLADVPLTLQVPEPNSMAMLAIGAVAQSRCALNQRRRSLAHRCA